VPTDNPPCARRCITTPTGAPAIRIRRRRRATCWSWSAPIDFALRGISVVLLDDADQIGEGSRAICWSKRTLEILDRLGLAERLISQGVTWKLGKVFQGEDLVYSFDLLPEDGHKMPAFINLPMSTDTASPLRQRMAPPFAGVINAPAITSRSIVNGIAPAARR